MKQDNKKKMTMAQGPKNQMKGKPQEIYKLPEDMVSNWIKQKQESEIRDCFNFYDKDKKGVIDKNQFRSILGNFGFINKNVKEIDEEIRGDVSENQQTFYFNDVLTVITKKWFGNKGRDEEIDEIYDLFVRKDKKVGINEIKAVFGQYLDIQISDADILEFIQDADNDGDGLLTKNEIATKMGYY
ncbi:hypothetical protein pb186bvf_001380 [Paramecium bursaria]